MSTISQDEIAHDALGHDVDVRARNADEGSDSRPGKNVCCLEVPYAELASGSASALAAGLAGSSLIKA